MDKSRHYIFDDDGEKVIVSEEVYRAYIRPIWKEKKRKTRNKGKLLSLERLPENVAVANIDVAEEVEKRQLHQILQTALSELSDGEIEILKALYFDKTPEREAAKKLHMPRNTMIYRRDKILEKLKKYFE